MPLVVVRRDPNVIDRSLRDIVGELPALVATALTCENPDGSLTEQDIEVRVRDFGPLDIHTKDVEIIIWANLYPERLADLDRRLQYIIDGIVAFMNARFRPDKKKPSGFVWILLQPASYGEF